MGLIDWLGFQKKQPSLTDRQLLRMIGAPAIYPDADSEYFVARYGDNVDVFTLINKIVEPASTVPVYQYDEKGELVEGGGMLALIDNPNPYMDRAQLFEAIMSFYLLHGNNFLHGAATELGLNKKIPQRLDILPPQWTEVNLGTVFNPVKDYSFLYNTNESQTFPVETVWHWKEFNPDYTYDGGHLKGMSRLKPLLKSITGSQSGYDSLVQMFQNMGAYGILTILGEDGNSKELNKIQASQLREDFKRNSKIGQITATGKKVEYHNFGLDAVDMSVIDALGTFKGNLADAYNFPALLLSGSQDRTYMNYPEARKAAWTDARKPTLDAMLTGLTNFLAPKFPGEEKHKLKADYSEIEELQTDKAKMVGWMTASRSFTFNEIREAAGFERLDDPAMDQIFQPAGLMPIGDIANPPDLTEPALKALGLTDYRCK